MIHLTLALLSILYYFLSEYLAFGNSIKLNDLLYKIKNEKIRDRLIQLSYFKLFVCRPCITFWLTFITGATIMNPFLSLIQSLITYKTVKYYDDREEK